jgi:Domain of Unknown Function (DUF1080)
MKFRILIAIVCLMMIFSSVVSGQKKIELFNGKDLGNWIFKLKDPSVDPKSVFTVKDGIIHISGSPFGYMRTKDVFSDFRLHVEWRWPAEATNSGVFVFAQPPDTVWLKCIECQLMAGNAGDFVCMGGAEIREWTDRKSPIVKKMAASSEKPAGEWNTMEVICKGNTIEVHVNGVLQNKATGVNLSKGSVCLQSEGKEIVFRNVWLTRL